MGEIIKNPDGTRTMKGFSTKNPKDMERISAAIRDEVISKKGGK